MADEVFCCSRIQPYRPNPIAHDKKFGDFLTSSTNGSIAALSNSEGPVNPSYAIRVVEQIRYGEIESRRYFTPIVAGDMITFEEVYESTVIDNNLAKANARKNMKCMIHNRFYVFNLYQKDPTNTHHWRTDTARPAGQTDAHGPPSFQTDATPAHPNDPKVQVATGGVGFESTDAVLPNQVDVHVLLDDMKKRRNDATLTNHINRDKWISLFDPMVTTGQDGHVETKSERSDSIVDSISEMRLRTESKIDDAKWEDGSERYSSDNNEQDVDGEDDSSESYNVYVACKPDE